LTQENITVTYQLTPKVESIHKAADLLLAEMTSGMQYISTRKGVEMYKCEDKLPFIDSSVKGEILSIQRQDEDTYIVKLSFPTANLDPGLGGISNLWAMVAGEVFSLYFIGGAKFLELELPPSFMNHYKGPRFGIEGIREFLKVKNRPLVGAIIKPNLGLTPERTARVVSILAKAGFDFVKDDEVCVNPDICSLKQRVKLVAQTLDKIQEHSEKKMLYMADVTSDFSTLGKAAEIAISSGANGLMIDPFCIGLSSIDYLRNNFSVPIYVHRVGYGLFCSGNLSISYEIFSKLFRMLGADFSHVGGIWGKPEKAQNKVAKYADILRKPSSIRATWPVVSGISLENMAEYYDFYGDDTLFLDHIGIYKDEESSARKLKALKQKMGLKS
jgi:ribulose-bisphosphate carboxylase large chain